MPSAAIILAAGVGSRLGVLSDAGPKWLLPVGDTRIADVQLRALELVDVAPVLVVGGHGYEALAEITRAHSRQRVDLVFNPRYRTANNWYSLLLGLRTIGPLEQIENLLVVNSDLWAPTAWLAEVFNSLLRMDGARLAVDVQRPLSAESMKVSTLADGSLSSIGKRNVTGPVGEYIGALALDKHAAAMLEGILSECEVDSSRSNEWYEDSINRSLDQMTWRACRVDDGAWVEIDDVADLASAERASRR